jgi:hypothetical protein
MENGASIVNFCLKLKGAVASPAPTMFTVCIVLKKVDTKMKRNERTKQNRSGEKAPEKIQYGL